MGAAMSVLSELKRRKMLQVAAVYLVVAWLIMQIIDVIHSPLRLPEWFPTVVIVFLAIGFPIAMIISWAFNVTPGGVVRDKGSDESGKQSGRTIEFVLIGLVGVAVLWLIYRTEFASQPPPEPVAVEDTAPDVLPNSVAVLPFANLSPDPDNAFFAAGIHDTILNELAKIKDMNVISRTAMLRYADGTTPIPQIAKELRVETVMEGSVQYANGRVLVTAQLIDPTTNAHLWSESYDREFADIFAIQADIATQIAVAMRTQLSADERLSIARQMTSSPEAYALYLRAMELADWDFSPGDSTAEFHGLLDDAIELDPAFARAHAAKANVYSFQRRSQALAKESAETALSLDPNLGSAYSALAKVHARAMHNAEAFDAFDTALRLSPNDIDILDDFSRFLSQVPNTERSLQLAERVVELDPGRGWFMALMLWRAGDIEAALEAQRKVVAARPDNHRQRLSGAVLEYLLGNEEAATREARIASKLRIDDDLDFNILATYAQSYGALGFADEAAKYLDLFVARASQEPEGAIDPGTWARVYIGAGYWDKALEYIELAVEQLENGFSFGGTTSIVRNRYRQPELEQPEFVELRKRLGYKLPED